MFLSIFFWSKIFRLLSTFLIGLLLEIISYFYNRTVHYSVHKISPLALILGPHLSSLGSILILSSHVLIYKSLCVCGKNLLNATLISPMRFTCLTHRILPWFHDRMYRQSEGEYKQLNSLSQSLSNLLAFLSRKFSPLSSALRFHMLSIWVISIQ